MGIGNSCSCDCNQNLIVAIMGAKGLRKPKWFPESPEPDCFCILKSRYNGRSTELHRTEASGSLGPRWKQEFQLSRLGAEGFLDFVVCTAGDEVLGQASLPISRCMSGYYGELPLERMEKAYIMVKIKMPGVEDYQEAPPQQITFDVQPPELAKPLGLDVDIQDEEKVMLNNIKAGPFQLYNDVAEPTMQVQPKDFIVRVNNVEAVKPGGAKALVEAMKKATSTMSITIKRPAEFVVAIKKDADAALGVSFPDKPSGESLVIMDMSDSGGFQAWNLANPDMAVKVGDRIIAVDGNTGQATDLHRALSTGQQYQLTILRPACDQSSWHLWSTTPSK